MNPFDEWLAEAAGDSLLVDETEGGFRREAHDNCWSFSITPEQAQGLTQADVTAFIDAVVEARRRQLMRMPSGHFMTFYCWHDEQASQLRFSLVSASHGGLPFGAHLEECRELGLIVGLFLVAPHHNGIPLSEFGPLQEGVETEAIAVTPTPLKVWAKRLS